MKKIRMFFMGVKKEMERVRWPKGKELVKYSIATIACIAIIAVFFIGSDALVAFFRTLMENFA